ncbi:hypothetical protein BJ999_008066 [Actinomadura citrea]|jgi:hypothetical protein|uniref:Uncharacterized protein n=1 Tax=Actinomadura citrea TaxID=46158 RepID=A0A7Y9KHJ6_9ACTN|nr:hypothetical protein [Actinomadura citrea]GGT61401.1 hypothetical protein GCM10010177_17700 [Actinomadura citrea]
MPNPQQPEIRRSGRTAVTDGPAPEATAPKSKSTAARGHAHGTDKGSRGGGEGGGTPPGQKPSHPS